MSEPTEKLLEVIIEGLQNIKAKDIRVLNMEALETAVSKYFIVCHGTSRTHVNSIAQLVEKDVKDVLQELKIKHIFCFQEIHIFELQRMDWVHSFG